MLTQEYLKECLDYNPETGVFTWKERPIEHFKDSMSCKSWNIKHHNMIAGGSDLKGYLIISIGRVSYKAHRLAWLYVYGKLPELYIDHIDGNKGNNKIQNLRDVSHKINCQNKSKAYKNNKLGIKGVRKTGLKKYRARIRVDGKLKHIGMFDTPQQAHAAYLEAKKIHHKGYIHD